MTKILLFRVESDLSARLVEELSGAGYDVAAPESADVRTVRTDGSSRGTDRDVPQEDAAAPAGHHVLAEQIDAGIRQLVATFQF